MEYIAYRDKAEIVANSSVLIFTYLSLQDQQPNSKNDEENSDSNNVTTEKLATPVETTEVN